MAYQGEAMEQQKLIEWCDWKRIPIFAIPNGGKRNAKEAHFMKLSGVKAGVPDLFLPIASNGCHGLFIEMKYGKNKPTENQEEWIALLMQNGYQVAVCYSADAAIDIIRRYLNNDKTGNPRQ